jgi:hypothetical protein
MDKVQLDTQITACFYPFGTPNPERLGFFTFSRLPRQVSVADIAAVADLLGRPVRFEDEHGYEHALVAGAVHPGKGWLAWVEYRCRKTGSWVDVEFRLRGVIDGRPALDWPLECYNPFFGCHAGYLAWHGNDVILLYREKHRTYACSLGEGRPPVVLPIGDEWLVVSEEIAYRDRSGPGVHRLALPGLTPLQTLAEEEARARGMLPTRRWS